MQGPSYTIEFVTQAVHVDMESITCILRDRISAEILASFPGPGNEATEILAHPITGPHLAPKQEVREST